MTATPAPAAPWLQDDEDPGWWFAAGIGSVRSTRSYGRCGWWFLPAWLPNHEEYDVGPFRTKALAMQQAERLAAEHRGGAT